MKWLALITSFTLCVGVSALRAEDLKPATHSQPVNVAGTWSIIPVANGGWATGVDSRGQSPESCTFMQTGDQLSGTCRTVFGEGPVVGSVKGQDVDWRWLYKRGGVRQEGNFDFLVAVFHATLLQDNRLGGGFLTHETYDKFRPSFEYKTTFRYVRPRQFTADRQS